MDIKVITRHAPFNYGSLLQSMATLKIVRRLGHKCCIIDYIRDDEYGLKSILMSLDRKKEWNNNFLKSCSMSCYAILKNIGLKGDLHTCA